MMRRRLHWIRWFLLGLMIVALFLVLRSCLAPTVHLPKVLFGLEEGTKIPIGSESIYDSSHLSLDEQDRRQILQIMEAQKQLATATNLERMTTWINQYADQDGLFVWVLQSELERPKDDDLKKNFVQNWSARLDSLVAIHPRDPKLLYLQALSAKLLGSALSWDTLSASLVKLSPHLPYVHVLRGQYLLSQCRLDSAKWEFKAAVSLASAKDRAQAYALLAQSYYGGAQSDSGMLILDNALKIYPTDAQLLLSSARWKEGRGDLTGARIVYEKLMGLFPAEPTYRAAIQNLGKNEVLSCRNSVGARGASSTPAADLSVVIQKMKVWTDKYPEDLGLRLALASIYMDAGRVEESKEQMAEVRKLDSSNLDVDSLSRGLNQVKTAVAPSAPAMSTLSDQGRKTNTAEIPDFGEYLVAWGKTPQEFFAVYPSAQFKQEGSLWLQHLENDQLKQDYSLNFSQGFVSVQGFVRSKTGMADLLGRVLRHKAQVSGQPTATESVQCAKQEYNTFLWENSEMTELVFQHAKKSQSVGILRLSPKSLGPKTICQLIQMVH